MEDLYFYLWIGFAVTVAGGGLLLFLLSKFYKTKSGVTGTLPYIAVPLLTDANGGSFPYSKA